jgi:hypothetical protein
MSVRFLAVVSVLTVLASSVGCRRTVARSVAAAASTPTGTEPTKPSEIGPHVAMARAVRMAEERDYAGFATRVLQPGELAAAKQAGKSPEQLGRDRMGDPVEFAARIRRLKSVTPVFSTGRETATYESGGERIVLVQVNKHWYFQ